MKFILSNLSRRPVLIALILGLLVLLGAGIVVAWTRFDVQMQLARLFRWLESVGPWRAALSFIAIYTLVVVLMVPGVVFTFGAGFLFGTAWGSLYVIAGTTLGATVAFFLGNFFFEEHVKRFLETHDKLKALNDVVADKPWQVVMLTRMMPLFPFKPSNYVFGVMGIRWRDFVIGTAVGIIPFTLTNVYAGALAGDLTALSLRGMHRSPLEWGVYGAGLILLVAFVIVIGRQASKRLAYYRKQNADRGP